MWPQHGSDPFLRSRDERVGSLKWVFSRNRAPADYTAMRILMICSYLPPEP
jgi:hypothetical protein